MRKVKIYFSKSSLFNSVMFLIIGIILYNNPDSIIKWISYIIGFTLIVIGSIKIIDSNKTRNQNGVSFGVVIIVLGVVCFILSGVFETLLRFVIGGWILINGVEKLSKIMAYKNKNYRNLNYTTMLIFSIALILIGAYIIIYSNILVSVIGLLMIIYSIIDLIGYMTQVRLK